MYGSDGLKGLSFARQAIALGLAKGHAENAREIAAHRWGEASQPCRVLTKAAVSGGSTQSGNWGEPLSPDEAGAAAEFIGLVRQTAIIGQLAGLRRVPHHVPILTNTAGVTGSWVKEGQSMPLSAMSFVRETLGLLKVAAMTVTSEELLEAADPSAEQGIRDELVRACAEASDAAFIAPANAGIADTMPASVTHGVTPVEASTTFKASLERLIAGFTGDLTQAYLIGRPELFVQISGADYPNVGARGGEVAGIPAIASRSVPNDANNDYQLALVDPTGVTFTDDPTAAQIKTTQQASIEFSDAPTNNGTTPTATNQISLYQVNGVGIAALMWENWRVSRAGSVALLNGIAPTQEPAS